MIVFESFEWKFRVNHEPGISVPDPWCIPRIRGLIGDQKTGVRKFCLEKEEKIIITASLMPLKRNNIKIYVIC